MSRTRQRLPAAAALLCVLAIAALGDDTPLFISNTYESFDLDTNCGETIRVKSLSGLSLSFREGETISQLAPGESSQTVYFGPAEYSGTTLWTPTIGGTWTLVNSGSGTAVFGVRYSLFSAQGDGSVANPYRLVDDDELEDLVSSGTASNGTVFILESSTSISGLALPAGYGIDSLGGGAYRLTELGGGPLFTDEPKSFALDTELPGPDRKAVKRELARVAYSGDNWLGGSAASTLAVTSPTSTQTQYSRTGSGYIDFRLNESGLWTLALSPSSGTALAATIDVKEPSTFYILH